MDGRTKCRILKGIRQKIADINGINYEPYPCSNTGDCIGTCSLCERESEWLWLQLKKKESEGYRIYITSEDMEKYEFQNNVTKCKTDTIGI